MVDQGEDRAPIPRSPLLQMWGQHVLSCPVGSSMSTLVNPDSGPTHQPFSVSSGLPALYDCRPQFCTCPACNSCLPLFCFLTPAED